MGRKIFINNELLGAFVYYEKYPLIRPEAGFTSVSHSSKQTKSRALDQLSVTVCSSYQTYSI